MSDHHPAPPESDESLLARLREGDRNALGLLVRRYERELFGYLRRYVGDDNLADDVFQNTFLQVYLKIDQYEPGRPARPWIYTIATNQAIDALRRRNRRFADRPAETVQAPDEDGQPRPLFELLPGSDDGPVDAADREEQRELVRAAVGRLPESLRQAVLLVYFQGFRYQEAAEIMGIPVGTVKSRLHAALTKLSAEWFGEDPEPVPSPLAPADCSAGDDRSGTVAARTPKVAMTMGTATTRGNGVRAGAVGPVLPATVPPSGSRPALATTRPARRRGGRP